MAEMQQDFRAVQETRISSECRRLGANRWFPSDFPDEIGSLRLSLTKMSKPQREDYMTKALNLMHVFSGHAEELLRARDKSALLHRTSDIRAAGNHVEEAFRKFLKSVLSPRYYVTHGHLIDGGGNISPQLDVIIADQFNLPSVLTGNDGTEYIPATSAFAIGEIKSTYDHSKGHYKDFCKKICSINNDLSRPLISNTAYELTGQTELHHAILGSRNQYLNHLYSFLFCVDCGDFRFEKLKTTLTTVEPHVQPNVTVFLGGDNSGILTYAKSKENSISYHKYPYEVQGRGYRWCFVQGREMEDGSQEGVHLANLYAQIFDHLASSHLERTRIYDYFQQMVTRGFSKSSLQWT